MFWVGLIIGLFVGSCVGLIITALMTAAKFGDYQLNGGFDNERTVDQTETGIK